MWTQPFKLVCCERFRCITILVVEGCSLTVAGGREREQGEMTVVIAANEIKVAAAAAVPFW